VKFTISRILLLFFLPLSNNLLAQTWELGGFVGTAGYMGDLNPVKPYKVNNLALGGHIKRNFDGYWSLKLNVAHGTIEAEDSKSDNEYYKTRNLSFFTPITEVSLQTEFNFFNYIPSFSKERYTPYLFTGLGFINFNPKTNYQGQVYELNYYGTEGQDITDSYKKIALTIPFGAGIKYNITGNWNLGAELGYRTAFTDYLDDVSGNYASAAQLEIPGDPGLTSLRMALADRSPEIGYPVHSAGTQRGDSRKHDTYLFLGITLSYTFFTQKCPVVN